MNKNGTDLVRVLLGKDTDCPETVWAIRTNKENIFEINNVPFYDYSVSLADWVRAINIGDNLYEYSGIEKRGQHSTFRIIWKRDGYPDPEKLRSLIGLNHSTIETRGKLFAIDIPKEDANAMRRFLCYLDEMEEKGVLIYEEGFIYDGLGK